MYVICLLLNASLGLIHRQKTHPNQTPDKSYRTPIIRFALFCKFQRRVSRLLRVFGLIQGGSFILGSRFSSWKPSLTHLKTWGSFLRFHQSLKDRDLRGICVMTYKYIMINLIRILIVSNLINFNLLKEILTNFSIFKLNEEA